MNTKRYMIIALVAGMTAGLYALAPYQLSQLRQRAKALTQNIDKLSSYNSAQAELASIKEQFNNANRPQFAAEATRNADLRLIAIADNKIDGYQKVRGSNLSSSRLERRRDYLMDVREKIEQSVLTDEEKEAVITRITNAIQEIEADRTRTAPGSLPAEELPTAPTLTPMEEACMEAGRSTDLPRCVRATEASLAALEALKSRIATQKSKTNLQAALDELENVIEPELLALSRPTNYPELTTAYSETINLLGDAISSISLNIARQVPVAMPGTDAEAVTALETQRNAFQERIDQAQATLSGASVTGNNIDSIQQSLSNALTELNAAREDMFEVGQTAVREIPNMDEAAKQVLQDTARSLHNLIKEQAFTLAQQAITGVQNYFEAQIADANSIATLDEIKATVQNVLGNGGGFFRGTNGNLYDNTIAPRAAGGNQALIRNANALLNDHIYPAVTALKALMATRENELNAQPFTARIEALAASINNATTQEDLGTIAPQVVTLKTDIKDAYPRRELNSQGTVASNLIVSARELENFIEDRRVFLQAQQTEGLAAEAEQAAGTGNTNPSGASMADIITGEAATPENVALAQRIETARAAITDIKEQAERVKALAENEFDEAFRRTADSLQEELNQYDPAKNSDYYPLLPDREEAQQAIDALRAVFPGAVVGPYIEDVD